MCAAVASVTAVVLLRVAEVGMIMSAAVEFAGIIVGKFQLSL